MLKMILDPMGGILYVRMLSTFLEDELRQAYA